MKKLYFWILALCLMLSTAAFAADTVKIGHMGPDDRRVGRQRAGDEAGGRYLTYWSEDVNKAGGMGGKQIKLISNDDGDSKTAPLVAQRLSTKGLSACQKIFFYYSPDREKKAGSVFFRSGDYFSISVSFPE